MSDTERPQGGIHLQSSFGSGPLRQAPREVGSAPRFAFVIAGDFGGTRRDLPIDISGEDIGTLLGSLGVTLRLEVQNHLGSEPPSLGIALPIKALRDLAPKTIARHVPEVRRAEEITAEVARTGSFAGLDAEAKGPRFDKLTAALAQGLPAPRQGAAAPSTTEDNDNSIDALLSMVDLPPAGASADPAKDALSAFLSATTERASALTPPPAQRSGPVDRQIEAIATHQGWRDFEAAWRSLSLLLAKRGRGSRARILLLDTAREDLAEALAGDNLTQALAEDADEASWGAILIVGGFGNAPTELQALRDLAAIGEARQMPVIVSLDQAFLGAAPEAVAKMDNPAALLEGPSHAVWRSLRERSESEFLFAAWNDVVLRTGEPPAVPLWGGAGLVVAAQILGSLARMGWPTEIMGSEAPMDGLDVVEAIVSGRRAMAIPLRAAMDAAIARDLARDGLTCPVARADRDEAWLVRAASVHNYGKVPEEARLAMESFAGLPFRFVSSLIESRCQAVAQALPREVSDETAAARIAQAIDDILQTTGPGVAIEVAPATPEDDAERAFEITVALGKAVMGGFRFSFDLQC